MLDKEVQICIFVNYPQVLHTSRINLSPFTKGFRVWGAFTEIISIFLRASLWVSLLIREISWALIMVNVSTTVLLTFGVVCILSNGTNRDLKGMSIKFLKGSNVTTFDIYFLKNVPLKLFFSSYFILSPSCALHRTV
jgi:hypothetical protein